MSAEAINPQWTPRDSVEAGILACVDAGGKRRATPNTMTDAYFMAVENYDVSPAPYEPSEIAASLLQSFDARLVEQGMSVLAGAVDHSEQQQILGESIADRKRWVERRRKDISDSLGCSTLVLTMGGGLEFAAVRTDASPTLTAICGAAIGGVVAIGYWEGVMNVLKSRNMRRGTRVLEAYRSQLALRDSSADKG